MLRILNTVGSSDGRGTPRGPFRIFPTRSPVCPAHRPASEPASRAHPADRASSPSVFAGITRRLQRVAALIAAAGVLAACSSLPQGAGPDASSSPGAGSAPAAAGTADDANKAAASKADAPPPYAAKVEEAAAEAGDAPSLDQVAEMNLVKRDLWGRIRAGFAMPELDTPLVAQKEKFYLDRPDYLQRMFDRGSRYLHYIVEEIEKRGMPTELALLPFVESAMNPVALSSAKAAGLWQFIPSTGRQYDLSQNWWVDNRRDVVQSTRAALDYLQTIYEMHGNDWFLALASYNWGENAVGRAVKRNKAQGKPADYLNLPMPTETRHYVPKLIALKHIVMQADEQPEATKAPAVRPAKAGSKTPVQRKSAPRSKSPS